MSTIKVDVSSSKKPVLQVGYQEENEVTDVLFDISAWVEEYGGGTAGLRVKRPQNSEEESYELSLPISENVATWTVSETDTYNKGNGKVQLKYYVGSALKESAVYTYKVGKSIVGSDNPVDPFDTWIERSKAWATGELLDGEDVPASDETYHNNSKYYAEQSGAQAEEAEAQAVEAKAQADTAKQYAHQFVGAPRAAAAAADMTDHDLIYVFTGTTTSSLTNGHWYYWNGSAWTDGGVYNSTAFTTDTTLSVSGAAADAKVVGGLKEDLNAEKNGDYILSVIWESGAIDGNSGNNVESNTTIRTNGYINLSEDFITKIHTNSSVWVGWYWYDENKNYLTRGSATFNGTYELTLSNNASYVRFTAVTLNPYNVKIVKDAQAVVVNEKATVIAEAHNQIANGLLEFVCPLQRGILNTSTGVEEVNNSFVRTDYINIADYKITGYYAPTNPGLNVIEYASDKTFVKRTLYSTTGVVNLSFNDVTVYVRFTWLGSRALKILQSVSFMMGTEKQQIIDGLKLGIADIKNLSEKSIHHDNFSRTESGYDIGKNSEGTLTDNSYDTVTGASSDDGVRVDNGLTIAADNSRTPAFTVRKINAVHSANFMVEFNVPESGQGVYIIYNLADSTNFEAITVTYNGTYYGFVQRTIVNGAFGSTIGYENVYNSLGNVIKLYFLSGIIAVYIDDKFCHSFYADSVDNNLYIGAYRAATAHFDFINVFDLIPPLVWNTEYLTDDGVSALPKSTISANTNRYALDSETTRFSNKSEHFMLYSTDEKINNGRRTERSLVALLPKNLRTMQYEFDVLFPESILPDTATGSYADIFFQLHDRQTGVSRGHVPLDLSLVGDEIHLSQYYSSEQASETLTQVVSGLNIGKVTYGEWMHFDIYIHERYEERQQPFMEIKINGKVVYQSRKPNCTNDVPGTSAQYGEYKNNFGLITYSERYFDNFKVTY